MGIKFASANLTTVGFGIVPVFLGKGKVPVASNFFEPISKLKKEIISKTKL